MKIWSIPIILFFSLVSCKEDVSQPTAEGLAPTLKQLVLNNTISKLNRTIMPKEREALKKEIKKLESKSVVIKKIEQVGDLIDFKIKGNPHKCGNFKLTIEGEKENGVLPLCQLVGTKKWKVHNYEI